MLQNNDLNQDSNPNLDADEDYETRAAKVEVRDDYVVIWKELENGDGPFMFFFVISLYIGVKLHSLMDGTIFGVRGICCWVGLGINIYQIHQGGPHLLPYSKMTANLYLFTFSLRVQVPYMLPNATRRGIPKYSMFYEVRAILIFATEDRQMYLVD